jgi:hypothetical protein
LLALVHAVPSAAETRPKAAVADANAGDASGAAGANAVGTRPAVRPAKDDRAAELPRFPTGVDDLSPRLPSPFVLPELSHPSWDLAVGWLVGAGASAHEGRTPPALGLGRATVEGDVLFQRRLYVGATLPIASALAPDGASGAKTVAGNLEAHVRVVFPLPSWLAFGAVLGVVAPTARFGRETGASAAATAAASLEPTDGVHFAVDAFALRPAMDVRVISGPVVVQARQGLDVVLDTSTGRAVSIGRFLGHIGLRVKRDLELSVEATQAYFFDERVSDAHRTAMTIGPGARLSLGAVDIGAAVVSSVFDPLSRDLDRFVAARFSLVAHLEYGAQALRSSMFR